MQKHIEKPEKHLNFGIFRVFGGVREIRTLARFLDAYSLSRDSKSVVFSRLFAVVVSHRLVTGNCIAFNSFCRLGELMGLSSP